MGIASQDYRDGAAWGADELARRLNTITAFGFPMSVPNVQLAANQIQEEMGGDARPHEVDGDEVFDRIMASFREWEVTMGMGGGFEEWARARRTELVTGTRF